MGFGWDVIYNGANHFLLYFSVLENFGWKHWGLFEKGAKFGLRERKYANPWGGGARARGQKELQIQSYCILSVFITIWFQSAVTFGHLKSCN